MTINIDIIAKSKLTVSTNELSAMLGVGTPDAISLMREIGVSPIISTSRREKTLSSGAREFRRWSLPQVLRRLEEWENHEKPAVVFNRDRAFRQDSVKKLFVNSDRESNEDRG